MADGLAGVGDGVWAAWLAAATVALLVAYEASFALSPRRRAGQLARTAHAAMREQWFSAVSAQPGSEVLAVQTLRNSLMSATMTASTAVLGLMGTVTLAAPTLSATLGTAGSLLPHGVPHLAPRLAMALVLLALLFASLVSSAMAVRHYTHASFIVGMPVGSPQRQRWSPAGIGHVRRAGLLYGWGLRQLILVAPVVAFLLHPVAGPLAALVVAGVLHGFDRPPAQDEPG